MATLTLSQLITNRLTTRLGYIQKIEAFNHIGKNTSSTVVQFPYGNWLASPAPIYRVNGTIITPTSTDTTSGTATISTLVAGDDVHADYTFKYFSTTDLENFYKLALSRYNNVAPVSSFTLDDTAAGTSATYPIDAEDYLTACAYKNALETLLIDLMGWKARIIFSDPNQLGTYLTTVVSSFEQYLLNVEPNVKGRRFLSPTAVSSGNWKIPAQVSDNTFQRYTVIRA